MSDAVYNAFLRNAAEEADRVNADSDLVRLAPDESGGSPPRAYLGRFESGIEYFARSAPGTVRRSTDPISFAVRFPEDYLRSVDPDLQFRVVRVYTSIQHPNLRGSLVCLGPEFYPGTPLRPLIEQVYGIFSSQVYATDHAFSAEARGFYLGRVEEVSEMARRQPPLWRRPIAARVRVERIGEPS